MKSFPFWPFFCSTRAIKLHSIGHNSPPPQARRAIRSWLYLFVALKIAFIGQIVLSRAFLFLFLLLLLLQIFISLLLWIFSYFIKTTMNLCNEIVSSMKSVQSLNNEEFFVCFLIFFYLENFFLDFFRRISLFSIIFLYFNNFFYILHEFIYF